MKGVTHIGQPSNHLHHAVVTKRIVWRRFRDNPQATNLIQMIESDAVDTSFFGLQHHWPNYRICPQQPSGEDYHACHADGVCEITECNIYVVGNMNFRVFHGTCSRPIAAEIRD